MRTILFCLALLSATVGRGQIFLDWYGAPAAPATLLLDAYPNAAVAVSFRKLNSAYTGDCIVVRRASDNALETIGFAGGVIDTATLKTFCASTDCFIRTWFDQSGNGNNFVQTTNSLQPEIVASGVINRLDGMPAARATSTLRRMETLNNVTFTAYYTSIVHNGNGNIGSYASLISLLNFPFNQIYKPTASSNYRYFANSDFATNYVFSSAQKLMTIVDNNSNTIIYDNGVNNTTIAASPNVTNNQIVILGYGNSGGLLGNIQEVIYYTIDQSANRTGIESNINAFYSIY
jgi:hypothetical protein